MSGIEQQGLEAQADFRATSRGAYADAYAPGDQHASREATQNEAAVVANGAVDFGNIDSGTINSALAQYNRSESGLAASEFTNQYDASSLFNGSNDASSIYHNGMNASSIINEGTSWSRSQSSANTNESGIEPIRDPVPPVGGGDPGSPGHIFECAIKAPDPIEPVGGGGTQPSPPVYDCTIVGGGGDPGSPGHIFECAIKAPDPIEPVGGGGTQPSPPIFECAYPVEPPVGSQPTPIGTNPEPITDPTPPGHVYGCDVVGPLTAEDA